jgi:hypothetical protein
MFIGWNQVKKEADHLISVCHFGCMDLVSIAGCRTGFLRQVFKAPAIEFAFFTD